MCRCADGLCEARLFTSSRTSASLLRMSSCRPWKEGTLQEKEKKYIFTFWYVDFFHGCQVRVRFKSTRLGILFTSIGLYNQTKPHFFRWHNPCASKFLCTIHSKSQQTINPLLTQAPKQAFLCLSSLDPHQRHKQLGFSVSPPLPSPNKSSIYMTTNSSVVSSDQWRMLQKLSLCFRRSSANRKPCFDVLLQGNNPWSFSL